MTAALTTARRFRAALLSLSLRYSRSTRSGILSRPSVIT